MIAPYLKNLKNEAGIKWPKDTTTARLNVEWASDVKNDGGTINSRQSEDRLDGSEGKSTCSNSLEIAKVFKGTREFLVLLQSAGVTIRKRLIRGLVQSWPEGEELVEGEDAFSPTRPFRHVIENSSDPMNRIFNFSTVGIGCGWAIVEQRVVVVVNGDDPGR